MAIPLLLVTVDIPAALDDLPFSFGGMFGFAQFRASPRGMGRYESQSPGNISRDSNQILDTALTFKIHR
jgi:hypothetical protein